MKPSPWVRIVTFERSVLCRRVECGYMATEVWKRRRVTGVCTKCGKSWSHAMIIPPLAEPSKGGKFWGYLLATVGGVCIALGIIRGHTSTVVLGFGLAFMSDRFFR